MVEEKKERLRREKEERRKEGEERKKRMEEKEEWREEGRKKMENARNILFAAMILEKVLGMYVDSDQDVWDVWEYPGSSSEEYPEEEEMNWMDWGSGDDWISES